MQNPRLAGRYAKSLMDLSTERNVLDEVYNDAVTMQRIADCSKDYQIMLKSPIIKAEKKLAVIKAVTKGKISPLMLMFLELVVKKTREFYLPEILDAFIEEYDKANGINHITLHTASPVSDEMKALIIKKIEAETPLRKIDLINKVNEHLIGGFVLEYHNNLVDASIRKYLKDVKSQFKENQYIFNIR